MENTNVMNESQNLPNFGGNPVAPEAEEFTFTGDTDERPSKYDFQPGTYNARTVGVVQSVSKSSGNPQLTVQYLGVQGPIAGLKFTKYMPLAGKALWITEKTLINVYGATKDKATKQVKFKKADVVDKLVALEFVAGEYNGKSRNEIKNVLPPVEVDTQTVNSSIPF